jgi:hypothetical protein
MPSPYHIDTSKRFRAGGGGYRARMGMFPALVVLVVGLAAVVWAYLAQ